MHSRVCLIAVMAIVAGAGCERTTPAETLRANMRELQATLGNTIHSSWPTYGADARRTSVNLSSCSGPLSVRWSFRPENVNGREARAKHVAVDERGVFVAAELGESSAGYALRIDDGTLMWTYDSRTDIHHGRWPTLTDAWVVLNDDGLFVLDPETGKKQFDKGLDWWGQTLTDEDRLYLVNTYHIHGPPVFVGAMDAEMEPVWRRNVYGTVAEDYRDSVGAIALDDGALYQAVDLRYGALNGVFAFDAKTGAEKWHVSSVPEGAISAADHRVFGVEREDRDEPLRMTARKQSDGSLIWAKPVADTDRAAPAIAGERLLSFSRQGVVARSASTGEDRWHRTFSTPARPPVRQATHIAVSWMSQSVIVAAGIELAVLHLADGSVLWQGAAPGDGDGAVHSPVVAEDSVYVVRDGAVFALGCGD
jgi:outer membrane protein assembly factor BamB